MTISIHQGVSVSYDMASFHKACDHLVRIKKESGDDVLEALLGALLFRQLELRKPGTLDCLISKSAAKEKADPKPRAKRRSLHHS